MYQRHKQERRGIILLIVLSLLTIFMLLATAFIVVSGNYQSAAAVSARLGARTTDPSQLTDDVLYTLMVDTNDTQSPMRGHALLRDLYGDDGFTATVAQSFRLQNTGNQFFAVQLATAPPTASLNLDGIPRDYNGLPYPLRPTIDFYNGRVLTFVNGPLNGISTRIIDYVGDFGTMPQWPTQTNRFRLMPIDPDVNVAAALGQNGNRLAGSRVVINGRPFSGSGFGFNPVTGHNDAGDPGADGEWGEIGTDDDGNGQVDDIFEAPSAAGIAGDDSFFTALQPNRVPLPTVRGINESPTSFQSYIWGGADESYDAADYQNMHLAALLPNDPTNPNSVAVIPSFHRPALINWWQTFNANNPNLGTRSLTIDQQRRVVLRPLQSTNPNFNGSNPDFVLDRLDNPAAINPWDVDNDRDGVPDSIWIDPGLPIQEDSQGRLFKPLVAILCTDLDGRLNVNAHGSRAHLEQLTLAADAAVVTPASGYRLPQDLAGAPALTTRPVQGVGTGPADINLRSFFGDAAYANLLNSRYGDGQPGRPFNATNPQSLDQLALVKYFDFPLNFNRVIPAAGQVRRGVYETPPDLNGALVLGLDHRGQPRFSAANLNRNLLVDHPYEANLMSENASDRLFSQYELEEILRFNDPDVVSPIGDVVPHRLLDISRTGANTPNLLANAANAPLNRRLITTRSMDLPVPNMLEPPDLVGPNVPGFRHLKDVLRPRANMSHSLRFHHVSEILRARLIQNLMQNGQPLANKAFLTPADELFISNQIALMLSPDLAMGLRMDVNRPFGNGLDDNNNGIVDEHGGTTAFALEAIDEYVWTGTDVGRALFDHDNDGIVSGDPDAFLARHHYARHLYVLLMMLKDPAFVTEIDVNGDGDGTLKGRQEDTARLLAQWAINAVDFRDADSIMTPFEFDLRPFNGWNVDGFLGATAADDAIHPDREVVWGVERPEMLLTETLAFHDRRTEDLDAGGGTTEDMSDDDFDQRLKPWGSFYFELYNPWASDSVRKPLEFYNGTVKNSGLQMDRIVANLADPTIPAERTISRNIGGSQTSLTVRSPLWRVLVIDSPPRRVDFSAPDSADMVPPDFVTPKSTDRVIYMASDRIPGDTTVFPPAGAARIQSPRGPANFAALQGGRYAVVGTVRKVRDSSGNFVDANLISEGEEYINPIGRRTDATDTSDPTLGDAADLKMEVTRRFVMRPSINPNNNTFNVVEVDGDVPEAPAEQVGQDILPPVAIPVPELNLTEGDYAFHGESEGFDDTLAEGEGAYVVPLDLPLDEDQPHLWEDKTHLSGTTAEWNKVAHLQRLANPLLPWNPPLEQADHNPDLPVNPYMTVDSLAVDLTTYNGVVNNEAVPSDPTDPSVSGSNEGFVTRQRGGDSAAPPGTPVRALWKRSNLTDPAALRTTAKLTGHRFQPRLSHTLGFLNSAYGIRANLATAPGSADGDDEYIGVPLLDPNDPLSAQPFPWLTWLNRPFTSHYEMQLVPRSTSFSLLRDWAAIDPTRTKSAYEIGERAEFSHLLNFQSTITATDPNNATPKRSSNLAQVFEFIHVPSKFVGTETVLSTNPNLFPPVAGYRLRAPFNRISTYQEPGKVNINTIYSDAVADAIRGAPGNFGIGPLFPFIVNSRRGYATLNGGEQHLLSPAVPTLFGNPFRSVGSPQPPLGVMHRPPVEGTLLRSSRIEHPALALQTGNTVPPWPQPRTGGTPDEPLFSANNILPHRNTERNPYFRYEPMQRFANLVTTRSNVYAIWITVGFFEVENVSPSDRTPRGYRLGREIGWDTGEATRHRSFYIVDRSIPVAFEPGQRHNAEKAILLRRFIE